VTCIPGFFMQANENILNLLREEGAQAERKAQRGIILQPGAIGDCVLTLPLARFMKESLGLGTIDIMGHTEYIGIMPGRTCVDSICSIDSANLHRLFVKPETFDLADGDSLINAFSAYVWIVSFLGEPGGSFEQNLIYTANCSHSVEVMTLSMKPPKDFHRPLAESHIIQFIDQSGLSFGDWAINCDDILIKQTPADTAKGRELLAEACVDLSKKLVIIQPGSGGADKCWHLNNFLSVAGKIISKGFEVVFLFGPAEQARFSSRALKNISKTTTCLTDLSLTQVLAVLSCAHWFIGNDSGITHLAAASGIRTLVVFGPTNPKVYAPMGPGVRVFARNSKIFSKKPSLTLQNELLEAFP